VSLRTRKDSVRPRLQSGAGVRPLNFTVRRLSMRTVMRLLAILVTAVATYYFVFWFGGVALFSTRLSQEIVFAASIIGGLAAATVSAWYVWTRTQLPQTRFATSVLLGALLTGSVAFSAGFFGPIVLTPHWNQGPMLGLFITGPLGVVLGSVGGAIYWLICRRGSSQADQ
jgi:hypothetical protein